MCNAIEVGKLIYKKSFLYIAFILTFIVIGTLAYSKTFANELAEELEKPKIERHLVFDTIPLNLEEIAKSAGKVFSGECTKVEYIENDKESNLPVVKYTFKVLDGLKDVKNGEEVTFKQWEATTRNAGYTEGEKYFLFLYPASNRGLTSPVGFLQGQFQIQKKGFLIKKDVVINKAHNKGLHRNLRTQKKLQLDNDYLNNYLHKCSELGIPMRYKEFVQVVEALVDNG
ncbi:MAG: hypothetical protein HYZ79_07780 [Candidatus Melainabacteria bacterium]|nr:hypothetical protein [Candidatus Melainabacteria bacterium]